MRWRNKFNTTKGNHKVEIYDSILSKLETRECLGFTGYYVEIIPKNKDIYNKPFTPSDNKTKQRRPINEKIRLIDGKSFYALVTGRETALQELFEILPEILIDCFDYKLDKKEATKYLNLFGKAFST